MRKWTRALPTIGAFALSAAVFNDMPAIAPVDLSPLLPPEIDVGGGEVGRTAALLLLPITSLGVLLLFTVLERISTAVGRFQPTYNTVVFAVTALVALMHLALVGSTLGWPVWTYRFLTAMFGIGIIAAGNVMPRVRPNWIVGIRTPGTLSDPAVWSRTHRVLGALLLGVGCLVVLLSLIAPRYALVSGLIVLLPALVLAHMIGARSARAGGIVA